MIKQFDNYIFDFDGTIAETNKLHEISFLKTFKIKNIDIKNFKYEKIKGLTTEQAFKNLGLSDDTANLSKIKRDNYKKYLNKITPYKNCIKTLFFLKKNKKKIFIVSGSSRKNIIFFIKKFKLGRIGIIARENSKFSKPSPIPYSLCLKKFNLKKNKTVVIEDAISGITSAKKNKLYTIGINDKNIKTKCDLFVKNFNDFLKKLNEF